MGLAVNLYVCSKPLQYFNVRNLPRNEKDRNVLVIEDRFKGAYQFFKNVTQYDKSWSAVYYAKNRSKTYFLCFKYSVNNLYYYLDFMFMEASFMYIVPCRNLYVYEEGISAYRKDIFKNTASYRRKIRNLLGMSEYPGFHPRVKGIYVYSIENYLEIFLPLRSRKKLNPLPFVASFRQMLEANMDLALKIFHFSPQDIFKGVRNKKVLLYITSWPIKKDVFEKMPVDDYDYCIIKPHPHIRELQLPDSWRTNRIIVIDSIILAEFLIEILIEKNNMLTIYHHNSSSVMYLDRQPLIREVVNI